LEVKHADRLIYAFCHQNCYIIKHAVKTSLIYIDYFRIGSSKLHAMKPDKKKCFVVILHMNRTCFCDSQTEQEILIIVKLSIPCIFHVVIISLT